MLHQCVKVTLPIEQKVIRVGVALYKENLFEKKI